MSNYRRTKVASYAAYVVQSIVNNFSPLLFVIFQKEFSISYSAISWLVLINFLTQLIIDATSTLFVGKVGYRVCLCAANLCSAVGLMLLPVLPYLLPPMAGLIIATIIMASGSGLIEVLVSPLMENLPTTEKAGEMSLLHSFFCWGQVGVVIITTLFLRFVGQWRWLPFLWAIIPLWNTARFLHVPIIEPPEEQRSPISSLFKKPTFCLLLMVMICGGACEITISQWFSLFAEQTLKLPKVVGDLLGPCGFAVFMGSGRVIYAFWGKRLNIHKALILCTLLCIVGYLLTALSPYPALSLIGCMICGLSVSLMWPGTFSLSSETLNNQGTTMFALLAMGGDLGCSIGPWLAGTMSDLSISLHLSPEGLRFGLLTTLIFPLILLAGLLLLKRKDNKA